MQIFYRVLLLTVCLFGVANAALPIEQPIQVEIVAEGEALTIEQPTWIAVKLVIQEGWHTYWKNPGDVGHPIEVEWDLPEGLEVTNIYWPFPDKEITPVGVTYHYSDDVWLLAQISPVDKAHLGKKLTLGANVQWLACSDTTCLPGQATLSVELPVVSKRAPDSRFSQALNRLPKTQIDVDIAADNDGLAITIPAEGGGAFPKPISVPIVKAWSKMPKTSRSKQMKQGTSA